jgi:hypothetical protein
MTADLRIIFTAELVYVSPEQQRLPITKTYIDRFDGHEHRERWDDECTRNMFLELRSYKARGGELKSPPSRYGTELGDHGDDSL